jgi:hypothetical protein
MQNTTADDFGARVCRLERENRALRRVVAAVLLCSLLLFVGGSNPAEGVKKVIEAERFVVRDTKGKERIRIGVEDGESSALVMLLNDDGREVSNLNFNRSTGASSLTLMTPNQKYETVLYMKSDGSSYFAIQKDKHVRLSAGMGGNDAGPSIYILDNAENVQFQAPKP